MLTYQVRPRVFRCTGGPPPSFPNSFEVTFVLQPEQPFGTRPDGGRTAVRGVGASVTFDANSGHVFVQSKDPLRPLNVELNEGDKMVAFRGNHFSIRGGIASHEDLDVVITTILYSLPILLNVEFADPPVIQRVEGKIGDTTFELNLEKWRVDFLTTTQEEQEQHALRAWKRFGILAVTGNRRLVAALHYFHVFCRLCRAGQSPWEFMAEAIVNLCKILEVLFPPGGDGKTMNGARVGLERLGYSTEEIERLFIPAMALRNNIDSGHVDLSLFTMPQLRVLHAYTEAAETAFRQLFTRLLKEIEEGRFQIAQYQSGEHDKAVLNIIERLSQHYGNAHRNTAEE